jgi:hypothetical protein
MRILPVEGQQRYEEITAKIKENDGFCICSLVKTDDTICVCKAFRESTDEGECHCGRFRKVA